MKSDSGAGNEVLAGECRERALRLLERKPHSTAQLRRKLRDRGFPSDIVEGILSDFQRVALLDDLQVARDYCAGMREHGAPCGRARIASRLRRYGISQAIVEQALCEEWDADGRERELERAIAAAERKLRLMVADEPLHRRRGKLYRYLSSRGFDGETCRACIDRVIETGD